MVSPVLYVREVIQELKKVSWPSVETTRNMTMLVIVVSLIAGLYMGVLDYLFQQLITWLISL